MIKIIEKGNSLPLNNTLFNSKIYNIFNTYGFTSFTDYWVQDENKAVIARLDNSFIIDICSDADIDEIKSFIKTVCFGNVLCDESLKISNLPHTMGNIMKLQDKSTVITHSNKDFFINSNPNMKDIYALLKRCESDSFIPPSYEGLVLDLSHKLNKETAIVQGFYDKDKLVSFAMMNLSNASGILTSVVVSSDYRRMGIGKMTVMSLLNNADNKDIFLQRASGENKEFYNSLGFYDTEKWIEYYI